MSQEAETKSAGENNPATFILPCPPHEEQRYKKLLEAATDYTYTVKIENGGPGETIHSIRSFAITGYTPREYVESPFLWFDMIHEEDRSMVTGCLARLMAGSEIPAFEHRIIHKNGTVRWVRNTIVPTFDGTGALVEYDALLSDITEQKQAREKTALANRAYKTLSRCNQALVRARNERELTRKICSILVETGGYSLAWVGYAGHDREKSVRVAARAGTDINNLLDLRMTWDKTGESGRNPAGAAIRDGRPMVDDASSGVSTWRAWHGRPEDAYVPQSSIVLPLHSEHEIFGALNIHADARRRFEPEEVKLLSELAEDLSYGIMTLRTRQKHGRALKALSASEMRLQAIFATVQAGIVIVDQESRKIVDVNMAAAQLVGLPPEKIIGSSCHLVCPAKKKRCPVLDLGQRLENAERVILKADGEEVPVLKSVVEIELGGRKYLLESFLDISKRVQAEQEQLKLQGQLRQAQKMEAIGTLAGGIAHDFNNMLHAILGYSGLLLRTLPAGSEQHNFALAIKEAGSSAAGLIRQILTFSRQTEKERGPLQLQYMIKEALKLLRSTLPATIAIQEDIDMRCSPVLADSTEIHQVIMNLGTNAYHAMRARGGTLHVRLDEVDIPEVAPHDAVEGFGDLPLGRHVRLMVSDTGHGMDQATMQRIFDPYFTTKTKGEGTGLGLAIVLGIIKSYRGAVAVRSNPGQGTTFSLYFPVMEQTPPPQQEESKNECPLAEIPCKKILFVDDVEFNVVLGEHTLRQLGCDVVGLTDSREALEVFLAFPEKFDLVITDQTMPHLTGFELARMALEVRPDIPIILLTGHSDMVDEQKARAAGIRNFLMKPMDLGGIAKILREIFAAPSLSP